MFDVLKEFGHIYNLVTHLKWSALSFEDRTMMQNNILNCLQAYRTNGHYVTNVSNLTHLQKNNVTDLLPLVIYP